MSDTEQLTGLALRKRLADAAEWCCEVEPYGHFHAWDHKGECYRVGSNVPLDWNDVMAAAEAAELRHSHVWNIYSSNIHLRSLETLGPIAVEQGGGPEAMARCIIAAVEARNG